MTWITQPRSSIGRLSLIAAGQGDPLIILIHGVGLRAEAWGGQRESLAQLGELRAVDMPGHGHSAGLPPYADLQDFTDAIAVALDRPAIVIGHSMGAMIALDMAVRYPVKVVGIAALNAIYRRGAEAREAVLARADALDGTSLPDPEPTLTRWFGNTDSPERQACAAWLGGVDPAGYRAAYSVFARADAPSDAALSQLAMPALFATGAQEPNSTPAMSRSMADLAPHGQATIIEGAAHMMPMTHAEDVAHLLCDFVKGCIQ